MRSLRIPITLGLLAVAATSALADFQIRIERVEACDADGNAATPHVGDPVYGMRVDWTVTGHAPAKYNVVFKMGCSHWVWKDVPATETGTYWGHTRFPMPLDGKVPISVTIDPEGVSGNSTPTLAHQESSFVPTPPTHPIEYFAPLLWTATQKMHVVIPDDSNIDQISFGFGMPTTETSQRVIDDQGVIGMNRILSAPLGYPVLFQKEQTPAPGKFDFTRVFTIQASNVRADLKSAMASWDAYTNIGKSIQAYVSPEEIVESNSPEVRTFVSSVLPSDYRKSLTPYEAAKKLFVAAAMRMTYTLPAIPDALQGLKKMQGDCGTNSSVYVACLRSIGIPARNVCGWRSGNDQWHGWSEIWVPGAGWMPQDVTDCQTTYSENHSKDGLAYYFAVIPDLNHRVVVCRGSTFNIPPAQWVNMQPGQWDVRGTNVKFPAWTSTCSLVPKN